MASQLLHLPKNAHELFGRKTVLASSGSFSRYSKWVQKNKLLLPYEILQDGGSDVLWRGLKITLRTIDSDSGEKAFRAVKKAALSFVRSNEANPKNLLGLESEVRGTIATNIPDYKAKLDLALEGRSRTIFSSIEPFLDGSTMLDVGAGNGLVSKLAKEKLDIGISLIDIIDYNKSDLPLKLFDGEHIPFPNRSFDISLLGTVLHHANFPLRLLGDTIRVTNKRLIVIESVEINKHHRAAQAFADWVYNRILNDGVNCPYNFQTPSGWRSTFRHFGLTQKHEIHSGIDMPLAPEFHVLYILERKEIAARSS